LLIEGQRRADPDTGLVKLLLKAHAFKIMLSSGDVDSIEAIARREGLTASYVTRLVRLAFLAPDIVMALLDGRHSPQLNAAKLLHDTRIPLGFG
jgi:hypothetical protein